MCSGVFMLDLNLEERDRFELLEGNSGVNWLGDRFMDYFETLKGTVDESANLN